MDTPLSLRYTQHGQPFEMALTRQVTHIGASRSCDITLDSPYLSARHFEITIMHDRVYVTDLGSTNGTTLAGRRLTPQTRYEWRSGDLLKVADMRFELLTPGMVAQLPSNAAPLLELQVGPPVLRPNRRGIAQVTSPSQHAQPVYFRSDSPTAGLHIEFAAEQSVVSARRPVQMPFQVHKKQPFFLGGTFRLPLMVLTAEGREVLRHVTVKLRPRYEFLLALLLMLFIPTAALLTSDEDPRPAERQAGVLSDTPTASPNPTRSPTQTPSPQDTAAPTTTPTPTFTPSLTPTGSATPLTPPVFVCTNRCAANGWSPYLIQSGDKLFELAGRAGISVSEAAAVNCIPNPSQIRAGDTICLPVAFDPPRPEVASCSGFAQTSPLDGLAQGPVTFYWDAPYNLAVSSYRVTVLQENGTPLAAWETGGANLNLTADVSSAAIGGSGIYYTWQLEALVNGQVICSLGTRLARSVIIDEPPAIVVADPGPPDLTISNVNITYLPAGEFECILRLGFDVNNSGAGVAVPFLVFAELDSEVNREILIDGIAALHSIHTHIDFEFCWFDFSYEIIADYGNAVAEANEENNTSAGHYTDIGE